MSTANTINVSQKCYVFIKIIVFDTKNRTKLEIKISNLRILRSELFSTTIRFPTDKYSKPKPTNDRLSDNN